MALIATLVCNPATPVLDAALLATVEAELHAKPDILCQGVAADFLLPDSTEPVRADKRLREILADLPVDFAIHDPKTRRKKALIADMDSTMIGQECIDELADMAGFREQVSAITARAMNGEIAFEPALRERVALLKGLPVSVIDDVIATRITLTSGGRELVATMKANGGYCALVSGGFTRFTAPVSATIGFDENRANILSESGDVLDGNVLDPILGKQAKVDALLAIAARLGITPNDFIAVGDGANDLGMLQLAGAGVALHAKPVVAQQARFRIDHGDLTALLYLQGYRDREIVR